MDIFDRKRIDARAPAQPAPFVERPAPPAGLSDHATAAASYAPSEELLDALEVALALGTPLLVTGEPGTGKTQAAYFVAWHFGLDPAQDLFKYVVRSTSEAQELVYRFDDVGYFRDPRGAAARRDHVKPGPLWRAYARGPRAVVLIDEIDKAPRDFPNDLLDVLDQHRFEVPEYAAPGEAPHQVSKPAGQPPPLVIITSNGERTLPGPFLRRCVFHHIELTDALLRAAVDRHRQAEFPGLDDPTLDAALAQVSALRAREELNKRPSTSEALRWLAVLDRRRVPAAALSGDPGRLPMLGALIKDPDDLKLLRP